MDTTRVVHIGSEIVIIGGITIYFHKQITDLKNENTKLKQELTNIHQALAYQGNALHVLMEQSNIRLPQVKVRQEKKTYPVEQLDEELKDTYSVLGLKEDDDKDDLKTNFVIDQNGEKK